MNYEEIHEDIRILMKDADECTVTNDRESDTAANAIVVCSQMRNELESFCAALKNAGTQYKAKLDAYANAKLGEKKAQADKAPGLSLDLDDFDDGPIDPMDELTAELTRSQKDLLF